ncbi:hypothetical protein F2Q70_00025897 [Brassica cretica]|uniref:Uncharacterized protein n=1 Tax=Brassica cretica TaxID=69181 RepID=A0A8S9L541_BRACR|nr:hypothetical protein F2Q70_00025897 [Brassica cretica]
MRLFGDGYRDVERCAAVCRIIWRLRPAIVYQLAVTRRCQEIVYGRVWLSTYSVVFLACPWTSGLVSHTSPSNSPVTHPSFFPISGESDEYMIFGWIGVTGLFIRILFGLRVTGVPIWYQSGAPSRFRPEMAIRGFGFLHDESTFVFWLSEVYQMFSICVMSQFVRLLRGLSISSVIILRLFRSGYVTFLPPPNFKTSFHEFLMQEFL